MAEVKNLSERENQVFNLIKKGMLNKQISVELEIDQKTVSTYVTRIKNKLNVPLDCNAHLFVTLAEKALNKPV